VGSTSQRTDADSGTDTGDGHRAPPVLVVTGPSGVGKGTLIRMLRERCPGLALSTSATTRRPRPGEVEGRDYHFLSEDEFGRHVERGDFLEYADYAGSRYGTLRSELERAGRRGLVLEIELNGARQVRSALPAAVQVFIEPPSEDALRERLEARGTDTPEQIAGRLARAREELAARDEFRHRIVNDDLERAVDELQRLAATIGGSHEATTGTPPGEGEPQ
jgi:guanylate kinase